MMIQRVLANIEKPIEEETFVLNRRTFFFITAGALLVPTPVVMTEGRPPFRHFEGIEGARPDVLDEINRAVLDVLREYQATTPLHDRWWISNGGERIPEAAGRIPMKSANHWTLVTL